MQPALHSSVPDASPAVFAVYGGKPHQGLAGENPAPHPGHEVCNFTVQLGMRGQAALDRLRLRCSGEQFDSDLGLYYLSARYYNAGTGRFMSRDPQEQCSCEAETGSFSLNKYLYASADPVDRIDPSGRADLAEEDEIDINITHNAVGQKAKIAAIGFGAGAATGTGLWALSAAIVCHFYTDAATIQAVTQNLGFVQSLEFYASGCTATSSRVPGKDIGPYPAPFYPDEFWATEPGNPWHCEANAEGRITYCWKQCPNGGKEWITWDPGTKYGEPPHWDWHRCDNTTCKIYTDGTSTCPPESE